MLRLFILICELIAYLLFSCLIIIKYNFAREEKISFKKVILDFFTNNKIRLALIAYWIIFGYETYIFLSINKLMVLGIIELSFLFFSLALHYYHKEDFFTNSSTRKRYFICLAILVFSVVFSSCFIATGVIDFNGKSLEDQEVSQENFSPTLVLSGKEEGKISIGKTDNEYIFYAKNNDGIWEFYHLPVSCKKTSSTTSVTVITTISTYRYKEKLEAYSKDSQTKIEYIINLNSNDLIWISEKTDD